MPWLAPQHIRLAGLDVRDPARRPERGVGLVRDGVARLHHLRSRLEGVGDGAAVAREPVVRLRLAEVLPQVPVARHRLRLRPGDLELGRRLDRVLLVRCDDADEVALADDARALDLLDRALVDLQRLVDDAVRPLAPRPHDAAVQHPRQAELMHVRVRPGDLRRRVLPLHALADQLVLGDRLQRRPAGVRRLEGLAAEQLAVGDLLRRVGGDRDDPRLDLQLRDGNAESRRREPEQDGSCLGRGLAHLRPAARDRVASRREALVRRDVGVPRRGLDLVDREVELFRRDLKKTGRRAGDVDLAEGDRGGVVRVDGNPAVDQGRVWRTGGDGGVRALRRAGERRAEEAEADHERAAALEERGARELRAVQQLVDLGVVEQLDRGVAQEHDLTLPSPSCWPPA